MDTQNTPTDVVIVGGGIAGLSAAAYLARGGAKVTLFEKAADLGGRAATRNYDGYLFNRGTHAYYSGGALGAVLADLGVTYTYQSPKDTYELHDGKFSLLPVTPLGLLHSDLLGWGGKFEFMRLLAGLGRIDAHSLARTSVQEWLDQNVQHSDVRRVLAATARTFVYSAALDLVSAEVFVDKLQRALKYPIQYVDGGWQTLVAGLRHAAEEAGARIVSDTRVEAVTHADGRVSGVRLADGRPVPAAAVVVATPPRDAAALVDGEAHPALRGIVDALVPGQLACLDVALRRQPETPYIAVQALDRPCFMNAQSRYIQIAPPGAGLVHAFKQLDPRVPGDPHANERDLEAMFDAALGDWRDQVVKRVYLPRIEAVGALPLARTGGFAGRPGPQVPGLVNLYLAGDWVGGEGFLADASAASARHVARLLLQDGLGTARNSAAPAEVVLSR